jgi:hypothetical protein
MVAVVPAIIVGLALVIAVPAVKVGTVEKLKAVGAFPVAKLIVLELLP